jgi:hypothetical protein
VGAVEWFAQGMMMAADYTLTRQVLEGAAASAALNPMVPLELEARLRDAGLQHVEGGSVIAESRQFLPSLQIMLRRRAQQATELGAVPADAAAVWLQELESRDARGTFYWAAIVRWAAGVKG